MGNVLTLSDLYVGHNNLGQHILEDPIKQRIIHPKQLDYLLLEILCHSSSLPNTDIKVAAVTLRIGSRSNCSYGRKVLVRAII